MPANRTRLSINKPVPIREKVYKALRNDILKNRILPDERFVETTLAKEMKISRTPVREALHILEREGLLEAIPRIGYRIRRISWEEFEEILELRAVLEPMAAKKVVEKGDSACLSKMEKCLAMAEEAYGKGDFEAFVKHDMEFDEILIRASGLKTLLDIWQVIRRRSIMYRIQGHKLESTGITTIRGHNRILEKLRACDSEGTELAIREHLGQVRDNIKRLVFPNGK